MPTIDDTLIGIATSLRSMPNGMHPHKYNEAAKAYLEDRDSKAAMSIMLSNLSNYEGEALEIRKQAWGLVMVRCASAHGKELKIDVANETKELLQTKEREFTPKAVSFARALADKMNEVSGLSEIRGEDRAVGY